MDSTMLQNFNTLIQRNKRIVMGSFIQKMSSDKAIKFDFNFANIIYII